MGMPAQASIEIEDWPGLITAADPNDVPDGAATVQVNCASLRPGYLEVRHGLCPITFDTE